MSCQICIFSFLKVHFYTFSWNGFQQNLVSDFCSSFSQFQREHICVWSCAQSSPYIGSKSWTWSRIVVVARISQCLSLGNNLQCLPLRWPTLDFSIVHSLITFSKILCTRQPLAVEVHTRSQSYWILTLQGLLQVLNIRRCDWDNTALIDRQSLHTPTIYTFLEGKMPMQYWTLSISSLGKITICLIVISISSMQQMPCLQCQCHQSPC